MRRHCNADCPFAGGSPRFSGERRILRFAVWAAVAAMVVFVGVGTAFTVVERRSPRGQLLRMELDVSRGLDAVVRAGDDEIADAVRALDEMASLWLDRFREWKDVGRADAERIFRLQDLHGKRLPSWRKQLSWGDDPARRKDEVVLSVLGEQSNWPAPPPPPVVWEVSQGVKHFSRGAFDGFAWPVLVGTRAWKAHDAFIRRGSSKLQVLRFVFFPYKIAGISFGWILGFGVFAVLSGYFLCHAGMKTDAPFLSLLGLLYFVYGLAYAMFVVSLLLGFVQ